MRASLPRPAARRAAASSSAQPARRASAGARFSSRGSSRTSSVTRLIVAQRGAARARRGRASPSERDFQWATSTGQPLLLIDIVGHAAEQEPARPTAATSADHDHVRQFGFGRSRRCPARRRPSRAGSWHRRPPRDHAPRSRADAAPAARDAGRCAACDDLMLPRSSSFSDPSITLTTSRLACKPAHIGRLPGWSLRPTRGTGRSPAGSCGWPSDERHRGRRWRRW